MPVSCARSILMALAVLAGASARAEPVQLRPESLPVILPPNAAFGLNHEVFPDNSLRYQFRHTPDFGGTFGLTGSFFGVGARTEFLYCSIPDGGSGTPDQALLQLPVGQTIDNSLDDGICTFGYELNNGVINPGDFSGSGGFVALRMASTSSVTETFFGYLEIRVNEQGELELLGGAREDESDTAIQTRSGVDDLFVDRFEQSGARGIDPIGLPMILPHDPVFSLSVWLREELDADFEFIPDDSVGSFRLARGKSPGFKRALVDDAAEPAAIAVGPSTSISDNLSTPADRAWSGTAAILTTDFGPEDRYLPVRFSLLADPPFFGYLGLTINSNGDLVIRSGDWETSPDTPISTP